MANQTRTFRGEQNLRRGDGRRKLGKRPIDPPRIPARDRRAMTPLCEFAHISAKSAWADFAIAVARGPEGVAAV
jgi:hypothetical protein